MPREKQPDAIAPSSRGGRREGSGRKKIEGGGAVPISGSVPADLVGQFDRVTLAKGWTRSRAITEAIRLLVHENKMILTGE